VASALRSSVAVAALGGVLATAAPPARPAPPTFESHWQDGRAELAGYRYHVTRYGQRREGRCAMITVTEPFSAAKRVKVDDPARNPRDTFEALKLNLSRSFQTGIYDYHTMLSLFVRSRDFSTVKVAFSSTEWCGQVYEEQGYGPRAVSGFVRSYFEDQSRAIHLPARPGGVAEDDLFLLLRGLRGDYLPPGRTRSVALVASPFITRLRHRPPAWVTAEITRGRQPAPLRVPGGSFTSILYTVRIDDGRTGRFWIESVYPHRILKWVWSAEPGHGGTRAPREGLDEGELLGSTRLAYWRLNGPGGERYLREFGLAPLTPLPRGR